MASATGLLGLQAMLVVHPSYHGWNNKACFCLENRYRLAYMTRPSDRWLKEDHATLAPTDLTVVSVCIRRVDSNLMQMWVVLPCGIFIVVVICATQVTAAAAFWQRYAGTYARRKAQHNPGFLVLGSRAAQESVRRSNNWCGSSSWNGLLAVPSLLNRGQTESEAKVHAGAKSRSCAPMWREVLQCGSGTLK
jgi:hypothetical protein